MRSFIMNFSLALDVNIHHLITPIHQYESKKKGGATTAHAQETAVTPAQV